MRPVPIHPRKSDGPVSLVREADRANDQWFYCHSPRHFAKNCPVKTRRMTADKSLDHVSYVVIPPVPAERTTFVHKTEIGRTHAGRIFETTLDISNGYLQSDMHTSGLHDRNRITNGDCRWMDCPDLYSCSGYNTDHYDRGCPIGMTRRYMNNGCLHNACPNITVYQHNAEALRLISEI